MSTTMLNKVYFLPRKLLNLRLSVEPETDVLYKGYLKEFLRNNIIELTTFQEIREKGSDSSSYTKVMGTKRIMNGKVYYWTLFPKTPTTPAFILFIPEDVII